MNKFWTSVLSTLRRGGLAFVNYPVSMTFACLLALTTVYRIYIDDFSYNQNLLRDLILDSIQISAGAASVFGLALAAYSRHRAFSLRNVIISNAVVGLFGVLSFIGLAFTAGDDREVSSRMVAVIFGLAGASGILFPVVPIRESAVFDYTKTFFLVLKSFFIALLYGGVIMGGLSFVAFSVESLLWSQMPEKVYSYLAVFSALAGYSFFLGYFPDFRKNEDSNYIESAENSVKQPKFAQVLFQSILVPVFLALTMVLAIWSIKIVATGEWPEYRQVTGIFTAYSLVGVGLYLIVCQFDRPVVNFFKKVFPVATVVFLGFEAYPLIDRVVVFGLKPGEYALILVWLFALSMALIFFFAKQRLLHLTSIIAASLVLLFCLPVLGAIDTSYFAQKQRLTAALERNNMLAGDEIKPADKVNEKDMKIITEAANFLRMDDDHKPPVWLEKFATDKIAFRAVFGFDEIFMNNDRGPDTSKEGKYVNYQLKMDMALNISGFDFIVSQDSFVNGTDLSFTSGNDKYLLTYMIKGGSMQNYSLKVNKNSKEIGEIDLAMEAKNIALSTDENIEMTDYVLNTIEDMTIEKELGDGVKVKVLLERFVIATDDNGNKTVNDLSMRYIAVDIP